MKKNHVRISIDLSEVLNKKLRLSAEENDMTMNAIVRLALEYYFKEEDFRLDNYQSTKLQGKFEVAE